VSDEKSPHLKAGAFAGLQFSTAVAGIGASSDDAARFDEQKLRNAVKSAVARRFSE